MAKVVQFKVPTQVQPSEWRIDKINGGIVYSDLLMQMNDNQSPDMSNLWFKNKVLTKRPGQEDFITGLPSAILAATERKFNGYIIVHSGTGLYQCDTVAKTATLIYNSLTANKGSFFTFKNKNTGVNTLYYKNNGSFIQYDGTTVSNVVGYIPKVIIGRSPTGGGTSLEQYNMLSAGFINSFSGNGSATAYTLTQTNLDATTVTCTIGGVVKVEGTDFTVNRVTGVVTFTTAPATGTDNILITAYKTSSTDTALFNPLYIAINYGGDNDTRVFLAGGSTTYYYSGLLDPTYWPENQYNNCGNDNSNITGFGYQYNDLIIFKERKLYRVTYTVNSDGSNPRFSLAPLNSNIGCDMPYTIQNVNNNLVWCNTYAGVHILTSDIQIKDEKNVRPISFNINGTFDRPGLLNQANLQSATSYVGLDHYWLCVGSNVWAWNYIISPYVDAGNLYASQQALAWFPFTNINASCFITDNQDIYIGDRTLGKLVHFVPEGYMDFGLSINAKWRSKLLDFELFDWVKTIIEVRYSTRSDVFTKVHIKYYWDTDARDDSTDDTISSFRWDRFRWDTFIWNVVNYAKTFKKRPGIKNSVYFSIEFSNNIAGHNLSIIDLAIRYKKGRRVK